MQFSSFLFYLQKCMLMFCVVCLPFFLNLMHKSGASVLLLSLHCLPLSLPFHFVSFQRYLRENLSQKEIFSDHKNPLKSSEL